MRYFGEDYNQENCGCCDNCLHPKPRVETKEEMVYVLETIVAMKQAFKAQEIVDVILGRSNTHTRTYKHHLLEQFGKGTDRDELYWKAVIRGALIEKLLVKEVEQFGILKLTPNGFRYIKNPYMMMIPCDHDYTGTAIDDDDEL